LALRLIRASHCWHDYRKIPSRPAP
jgi:hypothetical protein